MKVSEFSPFSSFYRSLVDLNNKIIYFWSPKCACTTIRTWCTKRILTDYDIDRIHDLDSLPSLINPKYKDIYDTFVSNDIINIEVFRSFKKILFYRDPFERMVSLYLDKLVYNDHLHEYFKIIHPNINIDSLTFKDFCDLLSVSKNLGELHFVDQNDPSISYDVVYNINNLNDTLKYLNDVYYSHMPHENDSLNVNVTQNDSTINNLYLIQSKELKNKPRFYNYKNFYNSDIAKSVSSIYHNDVQLGKRNNFNFIIDNIYDYPLSPSSNFASSISKRSYNFYVFTLVFILLVILFLLLVYQNHIMNNK